MCVVGVAWARICTVTASPRPDGPGPRPAGRPDSTDPDLEPVPGDAPAYLDDLTEVDEAGDPEAVEDGLHEARGPGVAVAERLTRRPRDMIMALAVLLAVVFTVFGIYRCTGGDAAPTVDAAAAYEQARSGGAFPVLQPQGLGTKWRAVSALYQPDAAGSVLRVGFQTPQNGNLQLVEGNVAPDTMLARELGAGGKPTGQVDLNGRSWQTYTARKGERAMVLQEPERTVIIVGAAADAELRTLASALR
jgi:hypothetical protein